MSQIIGPLSLIKLGITIYNFMLHSLFDNNLLLAFKYVNQMLMEEETLAAVEKVLEQHHG